MTTCKHEFGCHSCESTLKLLYVAIKEYLENEEKEQNRQILDMYIESTKKIVESILDLEEEK
jgi:hypothetical protein